MERNKLTGVEGLNRGETMFFVPLVDPFPPFSTYAVLGCLPVEATQAHPAVQRMAIISARQVAALSLSRLFALFCSTDHPLIATDLRKQSSFWFKRFARPTLFLLSFRYPGYRDFDIVKPISRGAFGSVFLARKKDTSQLYAMKVMRKTTLWRKNMVDQVRCFARWCQSVRLGL